MTTLRVFLTLVACLQMSTCQLDVKTAFLYALVAEQLFVQPPVGLSSDNPLDLPPHIIKRFCKLKPGFGLRLIKALYGLKQAPRNWFLTLDKFLREEVGLRRNNMDPCLYYRIYDCGDIVLLLVYVDDILIASTSVKLLDEIVRKLTQRFKVSSKGPLDVYLGIKIEYDRPARLIHLSQKQYIEEVCSKFNVVRDGKTETPLQPNWYIDGDRERAEMTDSDRKMVEEFPYRQIIGCCLYMAVCTRVDIAYPVNFLARYMESPTKSACHAAKRVLRYLINTADQRLTLGGCQKPYLRAFCDSDWAQCLDTRRSTASILIFFGLGCIAWTSQRMKLVAKSAAEAEYCVLAPCADEITWLRGLLHELGYIFKHATVMFVDNSAAIEIAANPVFHKRTKAIDMRAHAIREKNELGITAQEWIPTADNLADINTKPVTLPVFQKLKRRIMDGVNIPIPTKRIKTVKLDPSESLL
jgi:Reverse transcriptase (RNA-dependent DNA polymerase)